MYISAVVAWQQQKTLTHVSAFAWGKGKLRTPPINVISSPLNKQSYQPNWRVKILVANGPALGRRNPYVCSSTETPPAVVFEQNSDAAGLRLLPTQLEAQETEINGRVEY